MFLEVKNIETYYDKIKVLNGISFTVEEGMITAILGNNGAGKSTTMNSIMGLIDDQPEKGVITFMGEEIQLKDTEKIVRKGISYVPEGRQIFDELTVKENLYVGAYLRKDKKGVTQDMAKMFGHFPVLKERSDQLAGTLSGGEQQMLAIARALMNRPKLMILDEPSLGLSPLLVKEIFKIIEVINQEGITILLVEQNAHMAFEVAHHVYIMENGRFVMQGSAEELKNEEDVQEFYLGVKEIESLKGYQRYKRKRTWR
ncbi:MAG: ABC transporter ATP-binding protein [Saprospiraceae bacterium]|nr:ABC transporter ATP-binding protein [Saprospiraceae bacterium]